MFLSTFKDFYSVDFLSFSQWNTLIWFEKCLKMLCVVVHIISHGDIEIAHFVSVSWLWVSSSLGPALFLLAWKNQQVKTWKEDCSNKSQEKNYCTQLCFISEYKKPKKKYAHARPDQWASQTRKNGNKHGQSSEHSIYLTIFLALLLRWEIFNISDFHTQIKETNREIVHHQRGQPLWWWKICSKYAMLRTMRGYYFARNCFLKSQRDSWHQ